MSDSVQTYGPQPVRLLCPWDSPGKNTRVGCYALLQGIFLTQGLNPLFYAGRFFIPSFTWEALTLNFFYIVVQSLNHIRLFVTPWTAACQASLYFNISQSLLKLMSIESMMPSNHLILCHPPSLLPSIFPGIRVFSNELALHIRWPK